MVSHNDTIRTVARAVRQKRPFVIDYRVVLPDHLHCVWTLPPGDDDFTNRWRLIKQDFSKSLPVTERRSAVRMARGERGIWQRRFWVHAIRNDADYDAHIDYCHINPFKHGYVKRVADWAYSTFHRDVERGIYSLIGSATSKPAFSKPNMRCNTANAYCTLQIMLNVLGMHLTRYIHPSYGFSRRVLVVGWNNQLAG